MSQDFDTRIAGKRTALASILATMEGIRLEYIKATIPIVKAIWQHESRTQVERDNAITEKLSDARLRELKAEIQNLEEEAENKITPFLNSADAWWHLQPELKYEQGGLAQHTYRSYTKPIGLPDVLDKQTRFAVGLLGPILKKYGFLASRSSGGRMTQEWVEWDIGGNAQSSKARPLYPRKLEAPVNLCALAEKYATAQDQARAVLKEIQDIEEEKKRSAAAKRWDDI
jgi:hypothetical protein